MRAWKGLGGRVARTLCWWLLLVTLPSLSAGAGSAATADPFDRFLRTDIPPADGFDFPVGDPDGQGSYRDPSSGKTHDGWFISVRFGQWYAYGLHPGEDWNGTGGYNTDLGQPVHAVTAGRVVVARDFGQPSGGVVILQHVFTDNHRQRRIRSVYKHLSDIRVREGQLVGRRAVLAKIGRDPEKKFSAHLHFELRWDESLSPTYWPSAARKPIEWVREHYTDPSAFIRSHRHLFVPQKESLLVLVDPGSYRLRLLRHGREEGTWAVAFGRSPDAKTAALGPVPGGMYFVSRPATADSREVRLNFPNPFDAEGGLAQASGDETALSAIGWAWRERRPTREDALGATLVLRGWSGERDRTFPSQLPWGQLVLHQRDFEQLAARLTERAMVVILPADDPAAPAAPAAVAHGR